MATIIILSIQGITATIHIYNTMYVDLDTSAAPNSSDPEEEEEQLNLDPPVNGPPVEDDEDEEEEPVKEPTAAEIVCAGVARGQLDKETVPIDQRQLDEAEEQLIQQFAVDGCKCDLEPNRTPCCTSITVEHYRSMCCQMAELTHDELDLVVMGQVMAGCFSGEMSSHRGQERAKSYTMFHHNGMRICQKTFLFLHTMGKWRYKL